MTILNSGAMTPHPAPPLPTIRAERVMLRPLRRADAGPIALYCADERIARMTSSIPHPYPPGAAEAFIETATQADAPRPIWAIDGTPSGRPETLGTIGLKDGDAPGRWDVGYWIAPPAWGQGIAREALRALLSANPMGAAGFTACVFTDNPASERVLVAAGFVPVDGPCEGYSVARGAMAPRRSFRRDA